MLASELVTAVRRRCRIPDGSAVASDSEILDLANEEQRMLLTPLLVSSGNDYHVRSEDQSVTDDVSDYRIPERAVMGALRDVLLVDSAGDEHSIDEIPLEESWRYERITSGYAAHTLRLKYIQRPNDLIDEGDAAQITSVTAEDDVSASGGVGDVTTGDSVDVVEGTSNWDWLATGVTATVSGTDIALSASAAGVAVGDWVALAGKTPVVQLPTELQDVLVAAVAVRIHELLGDQRAQDRAERSLDRYLELSRWSMEPRVSGETPRVVNRNSLFVGGGGGGRWGYGGTGRGLAFCVSGDKVRLLKPGGRWP